ncbi:STE/STE11 protein kinase [Saprolegnia parasitica CBS 223.65]|uniref:STE/STE11 protein kinase n=1 Tax=Saprolegnia parasitica (strain CBS 223.65) TaxID=695850 RepID=A0A067CW47_SAPPC|nr:STE/STE11 protein kinase [Saprolegnia parasitica CBS 223.65]KDO33495.1 STE/STE11 protein kinase [Saprolegnia parasitica CBS 223.65]|eukprot:XP_012196286.1 STE/STE11 protein kinase [Saprolegnia parasitica CBS 223.65]
MGAAESFGARTKLRDTLLLRLHLATTKRTEPLETHLLHRYFEPHDPTRRGYVPMDVARSVAFQIAKTSSPALEAMFDVDHNGFFHYNAFLSFVCRDKLHVEMDKPIGIVGVYTVSKGLCALNGAAVTVKRTQLQSIEMVETLCDAIGILATFSHPRLLQYIHSTCYEQTFVLYQAWTEATSLKTILSSFGRMSEPTIRRYLSQVIEAMVYLHRVGIVHRDLHGESIYIDRDGSVQVGEFYAGWHLRTASANLHSFQDSLYDVFRPPETRADARSFGTKADVWCIGLVALEMLYGTAHLNRVNAANSSQPPIPHRISPMLRKFLDACFEARTSSNTEESHSWA